MKEYVSLRDKDSGLFNFYKFILQLLIKAK